MARHRPSSRDEASVVDQHARSSPRRTAGSPRPAGDRPTSSSATGTPRRFAISVGPLFLRERIERTDDALSFPPPHAGRASNRSGRAMHTSRIGDAARPVRDVIEQVEERGLTPVDVVEHQHQWSLAGHRLEKRRIAQKVSSPAPASAIPMSCDRACTRSSGARRSRAQRRPWTRRPPAGRSRRALRPA